MPAELLWKILLDAAILKASESACTGRRPDDKQKEGFIQTENGELVKDDWSREAIAEDTIADIYHDLAGVCRRWKEILDDELFSDTFMSRLVALCKYQYLCSCVIDVSTIILTL